MTEVEKNKFVGYEYTDITVSQQMKSLYMDGYTNFGWELDNVSSNIHPNSVVLKFRRDRKIRNKAELTRLQREFDGIVSDIESLERSKNITAATVAYIIGVIGTAFMAGSVFAVISGNIILTIILAIPGFGGWMVSYLAYSKLKKRKIIKVMPEIDEKYEEIYTVSKKGNSLLTV